MHNCAFLLQANNTILVQCFNVHNSEAANNDEALAPLQLAFTKVFKVKKRHAIFVTLLAASIFYKLFYTAQEESRGLQLLCKTFEFESERLRWKIRMHVSCFVDVQRVHRTTM